MYFYKKVNLPPIYQFLLKRIFPKKSKLKVLDLGCGLGIAGELLNSRKEHHFTGVDFIQEYLNICKKTGYYNQTIRVNLANIKLVEKSYDVVLLLQVLEHLTGSQARLLLRKAEKATRKCIIVTLPNGESSQERFDDNASPSAKGFRLRGHLDSKSSGALWFNNKLQVHKSTWVSKDLKALGFKVYGQSFKPIFGNRSYGAGEKAKLWQNIAVFLSVLITPLIYFKPEWGAQLIGVKYVKQK